jgi:hypothetical protein
MLVQGASKSKLPGAPENLNPALKMINYLIFKMGVFFLQKRIIFLLRVRA